MAAEDGLFLVWLALLGLGAYAALRMPRREARLLILFPPVYALVMYIGRAPMYKWYLAPMLLCSLYLGGLGIGQAISWAVRGRADRRLRAAAGLALAALVLPGLLAAARNLPRQMRHTRRFQDNERGLRRGVGLWLRAHTPDDAAVAMEAIGYQGYFSERTVIDMAGLISPEVVAFNASTGSNGMVFRRITTELEPDYLVLRSFEVDENRHFKGGKLFETAGGRKLFFDHYREARRFTAPHPELAPLLTHLTVYERR